MPREQTLAKAFVELADTLVADFDVVDLLHVLANRCVQLLDVRAAGLMLADQRGRLRLMASSSEQARLLELFELETDQGPCLDCYRTGRPVSDRDLDQADPRWARFSRAAQAAGFRSVHALPLRLREDVIGVLNLFSTAPGPLPPDDAYLGQALADVATIGLLQHRAIQHRQVLAEQLQGALNSRVLIEQAKGIIAERQRVGLAEAFDVLRGHARRHHQNLSDVAQGVVDGTVDTARLSKS